MPSAKSSIADIVVDAEKLLAALSANTAILPNMDDVRAPMEQALQEFKSNSYVQQTLTAERQKATQQQKAILARLRDLSRQLRDGVRSKLGARTEKLVEFGVQPLRPKKRRSTPVDTFPPPPPPVVPPGPPASGTAG